MVVALSGCLGFALVTTPLALFDAFSRGVVLACAAVLALSFALVWLRVSHLTGGWRFGGADTLALATIAVMTGLNVRYASQSVVQERDPGAYVDSARWFSTHHTFLLDGLVGAFTGHSQLTVAGAGFQAGAPGGRVYPQFLHLLPAFLAGAQWIGGTAFLFKADALLGGVALLAFFVFARAMLRPGFAAAAAALLALNIVQVLHSRSAYSEILSQIFLFGGLWALTEADRIGHRALYLVAGLLLGTTCMVRIDGFVFLIPLTIIGTVRLWQAISLPEPLARRARVAVGLAAVGVVIPSVLGIVDGLRFSRPYINDNKTFLLQVCAGLLATIVGCAVALRVRSWRERPFVERHTLARCGAVVAALVVVAFAWAWFVRPLTSTGYQMARPVGGIVDLRTHTLPAEIRVRTYSEVSMVRLSLVMGVVILAGAVLGLALVARRALEDPSDPRFAFLMLFGATTALYLWQPSIAGDMIWFFRRYLPVTIPGLIIFAMVLAQELTRFRRPWGTVAPAALVAGGLAMCLYLLPSYVLKRQYIPLLDGVEHACAGVGPHAAIVIVQSANVLKGPQYRYPQALQAFCGVPVATAPPGLTSGFYQSLAVEWARQGRTLDLVADMPEALSAVPGKARLLEAARYQVLERSYTRRPKHFEDTLLVLFFKRVSTSGAGT